MADQQASDRWRGTREPGRPFSRLRGSLDADGLANALGWFSMGLGLAQITMPEQMARLIGVDDHERTSRTMRALGIREMSAGIGLLTQSRRADWAWARVAGDAMDLALLGNAFTSRRTKRGRTTAATLAVVGVTALDVLAARWLMNRRRDSARGNGAARNGVRVRKSISVDRPVEEVYRFWRNVENLPRFMRHLESVQETGERRSHWRAKGPSGTSVEWDAQLTEDRENERIAWRSLPGADVSNAGIVRFRPAPGGRGTEVHVDLRYDPPAGPLGTAVAKLFGEEPAQQVADDLRRFKQVLETGEVVHSDASIHRGMHPASPSRQRTARRGDREQRRCLVRNLGDGS